MACFGQVFGDACMQGTAQRPTHCWPCSHNITMSGSRWKCSFYKHSVNN